MIATYSVSDSLHLMVELVHGIHDHVVLASRVQKEGVDGLLVAQDEPSLCGLQFSKQYSLEDEKYREKYTLSYRLCQEYISKVGVTDRLSKLDMGITGGMLSFWRILILWGSLTTQELYIRMYVVVSIRSGL